MNDSKGLCQAAVMALWGVYVKVCTCPLLLVYIKRGKCDSVSQWSSPYQINELKEGRNVE